MTVIVNPDGKIWVAIETRLSQWTETPYMMPGSVYQPNANQAFLIIQDVPTESDTRPIDPDCGEAYEGLINVSVMAPIDWTFAQHKGLCGRVADFLNATGIMTYSDALVRFTTRAKSFGASRLDQSWNRIEVQVGYRCWG